MKQLDVKGDRDTHAHAHLADQIDLGGHLAGYLLTIGTALELQEVVVEADLPAVTVTPKVATTAAWPTRSTLAPMVMMP